MVYYEGKEGSIIYLKTPVSPCYMWNDAARFLRCMNLDIQQSEIITSAHATSGMEHAIKTFAMTLP